jgi:DNA-binding NarL/FixJ family response regulator
MCNRNQENQIRLLVADDHQLAREGICDLLELAPDIEVVGTAENGEEAVKRVAELQPAVVLMDVRMPLLNGIDATRQIRSSHPDVRILGMSVHHEMTIVNDFLAAGASGYVLKGNAGAELAPAIRAVAAGEKYLCL